MPRVPSWAIPVDRLEGYAVVAWALLALMGLILLLGHWGYDDPYITFRYASNLLEGNGFVYNVGERVLSTTSPLYALILSALGLISSDLPLLSNVVSALALVSSSLLLITLAWNRGQREVGMIAALLLSVSPCMLPTFGAETCFYVMLVLAAFVAYDRSHLPLATGALALAAMVRLDGVLAFMAVAILHLVRRLSVPWRSLILWTGLVCVWYGGLWLYFGSPVPVTLLAKQLQGQMAISTRFAVGFLGILRERLQQPFFWLSFFLAILGLAQICSRARYWAPLAIWTILYFAAYSVVGVSRYFWYYAPLVPAAVVSVAEGAVALLRWCRRRGAVQPLVTSLAALLVLALAAPSLRGVVSLASSQDPKLRVYREVGEWLALHTPSTATVGTLEVGIIGYYARRPMIDFAGLIQPEVSLRFVPTYTYQDSATWAIQKYRPDYVVLQRSSFSGLILTSMFQDSYLPVRDFVDGDSLRMTLYQRNDNP